MKRILILCAVVLTLAHAARAQQTIFVPNCTGTAATDTANIQALITNIGSNTGNIKIPYKANSSQRCRVNTMTIPSNISLDNTDGTGIVVAAAQTLTVLGPRINPAGKPMFFGPGTTVASGGAYLEPGSTAGGDLSGTFPDPELENTGVVAGSCSNCDLIVDAKGRILAKADGSGGGGGSVSSVFGRTGIVVAQSGDYSAEQLSNGASGDGPVILQNLPTIIAPSLVAATATTINKLTITTPATGATLTIADNKTLTVSNTLNIIATDGTNLILGQPLTTGGTGGVVLTGGGTLNFGGFTGTIPATGNFGMGAGTNSVSSANDATVANHTHAITSSANPGAAASILASNASGHLQLVRLGIGTAPTQPLEVGGNVFINAATANLFMKDTSTGFQAASTTVVTLQSGNCLRSTNFTSGLVGFNICAAGNAEFDNIDVRGAIHAGLIVFNALQATAGSQGVFKSAGKLRTDATVPLSPTYGTTQIAIDIVDADGLTHGASQLFAVNDVLRLKEGLTGDTWFQVASVSDQTTFWRYNAKVMAGTGNATYRAGLGVADYGPAGSGFILQCADCTNAPYLQMATHQASFTSIDANGSLILTPRLRTGNLNGSFGYNADVYGLGTGEYGVASKSWLTVEQTNGIRIGNNTTQLAQWDTSGNILVGQVSSGQDNILISSGAIAIRNNTTERIKLNSDGSGFLANSSISWDTSGNLTVTANAVIGGWTITANRISAGTLTNTVGMDSTVSGGDDVRIFAGNSTPSSAPFRVTEAGALTATNATITGAITATSGSFTGSITAASGTVGGWTIGSNSLTAGSGSNTVGLDTTSTGGDDIRIYAGSATASSAPFRVTEAGVVTATNATITGTITSTAGTIGGWTLASNRISAGSGSTTVGMDSTVTGGDDIRFFAGNATPSSAPFRVTEAGVLTASNATITGNLTATGGSITGTVSVSGGALTAGSGNIVLDNNGLQVVSTSIFDSARAYLNVVSAGGLTLSGFFDANDTTEHFTQLFSQAMTGKDSNMQLRTLAPTGQVSDIEISGWVNSVMKVALGMNTSGGVSISAGSSGETRLSIDMSGVFQIWDGANMKTISFGANDSCGAGFRCVRIPN